MAWETLQEDGQDCWHNGKKFRGAFCAGEPFKLPNGITDFNAPHELITRKPLPFEAEVLIGKERAKAICLGSTGCHGWINVYKIMDPPMWRKNCKIAKKLGIEYIF